MTLVNETTCIEKWGDFVSDSHICSHPAGSASCTVPELVLIPFCSEVGHRCNTGLSLQGDSGAPLFCQKRDTYFLFGVVSWGSWRCSGDKPAVFTRVPEYNSWIEGETDDQ